MIEAIDLARSILNEPLDATRSFPDNSSSHWTDTTLMNFYNLIQQEVAAEINQVYEDYFVTQTFLTIVNGTAEYTLPSTFAKMRRVEYMKSNQSHEIVPVSLNDRGGNYSYVDGSSVFGNSYYLRGNQIVFSDTPTFSDSATVRLQYIRRLADITAASLTSELPEEHHRVLVWGVVKLCHYAQQANDQMINLASNEFEKHLKRIREQVEDRQAQRPRKVIQVNGGGY